MNDFDRTTAPYLPRGLVAQGIGTVQVNLGRHCNLACKHCHLECSSQREEMMSWAVMQQVMRIVQRSQCSLVDITGGAPELHENFGDFVQALAQTRTRVQVRTNFVALLEPKCRGVTQLLRNQGVSIVGSLPCYVEENVDAQRGKNTYQRSIEAIQELNQLGYGRPDGLPLDLVYNPAGAFLSGNQSELEVAYRRELGQRFGVQFTRLRVLTNMPLGRFKAVLEAGGGADAYMTQLKEAFNPETLQGVMCRHQVCVDWDGTLYDCDFNVALRLPVNHGVSNRIEAFDGPALERRRVVTGPHCFGCTAGAGSSCSGALA